MPLCLVLTPTSLEKQALDTCLADDLRRHECRSELCGFGPIAAAARTSQLIADLKPARILLIGIAGGLGDHLPVGAAYGFDRVVSYQIGVGEADLFRGGGELGWSQWAPGDIADSLDLSVGEGLANAGTLLTCCAASANAAEADRKAARHPDARAEDMEAFGVALAARLAGLPVEIIRGVSNRAGDRDKDNWRIDEALTAAAELAASAIACYSDSSN